MGSLRPGYGRTNDNIIKAKGIDEKIIIPIDLSNDPDYLEVMRLFQNGDFLKCRDTLDKLFERYPENPILLKFEEGLQLKLVIWRMEGKNKKDQKKEKVRTSFSFILLIIVVLLVASTVIYFTYHYFNNQIIEEQQSQEAITLDGMADQAEQLILVGNPQLAATIVENIRGINPDYEGLSSLTSEVDLLLQMDAKYQEALSFLEAGNTDEALRLFYEIQEERPGLWDVTQQIEAIETENQISILLADGNAAYLQEDWDSVISAYESALALDPQLDNPQLTEQLLQGYLKKLITMLQEDNVSIDDIDIAEKYYRKAVALIPQDKEFVNERQNLEEVSGNLLQIKYVQTAEEILGDINQNLTTVNMAVSYLSKAASIDKNNSTLQVETTIAGYYQAAFQDFLDKDWVSSITNLKKVMESDPSFAGGNTAILLYEAYSALGQQYFSAGFYSDALNNFEQAEIIAWDDNENVLKLFQVQLFIGDTYGVLGDYQNAVSYYLYALNSIDITSRVEMTAVNTFVEQATYWNAIGDYNSAYTALQEALQKIGPLYETSQEAIADGACLAFFAEEYHSTINAILEANDLPQNMVINFGRLLTVPSIQK